MELRGNLVPTILADMLYCNRQSGQAEFESSRRRLQNDAR